MSKMMSMAVRLWLKRKKRREEVNSQGRCQGLVLGVTDLLTLTANLLQPASMMETFMSYL